MRRATGGQSEHAAARRHATVGIALGLLAIHLCGAVGWRTPAGSVVRPAQLHFRVDPNRATPAELQLLPRIGPVLAANIVAYRESVANPPAFRRPEDLDRVPRIGPVTVELLRPFLMFPDEPTDTTTEGEPT
jgi:DNA uptake protein ComE-like DNA-binding protein